jgi:hypothetical protein
MAPSSQTSLVWAMRVACILYCKIAIHRIGVTPTRQAVFTIKLEPELRVIWRAWIERKPYDPTAHAGLQTMLKAAGS